MIKTRIRFNDRHNSFYVSVKRQFLFIPYWSRCMKKGCYKSDDPEVRYFNTYDEARRFAINMATDVQLKHKSNEYEPMV